MGFFKRTDGAEFIDYTLLAKKGILKVPEIKNDVIDFTRVQQPSTEAHVSPIPFQALPSFSEPPSQPSPPSLPAPADPASPFSFLDSLTQPPAPEVTQSLLVQSLPLSQELSIHQQKPIDMADLHIKLDTLEFKLEQFMERFDRIEQALRNNNNLK